MNSIVSLPGTLIEVDGMPLAPEDAGSLGSLRIQQRLSLPTQCELTFFDPEGPLADAASMMPGSMLRISLTGYQDLLFTGQVTAVEFDYGPSQERLVRVRGYDLLHRLRKQQPVATHIQVTLEELARSLVSDLGLRVEASEAGPVQQQLIQYRQSDFDLLSELAQSCGLYFSLRDQVLHILTLQGIGTALELELGSTLLEARIDVNANSACRRIETTGWDPWCAETHHGRADQARVGRRVQVQVRPDSVGGSGECTLVDAAVQGDRQAEGIAQAELDRRVAAEVTLRGVAEGHPQLRPGTPIQVGGISAPLAGRYVLTSVTHLIDRQKGYISEIETAPPLPVKTAPTATSATLGVVTQVEDPEGFGRVRVILPNYGEVETGWLGVAIPGAGEGKGMIALPDVNDRVLVLFVNGDPAQALVMGGLYGVQEPPDAGVDSGAVRRYTLVTPGEQRIQLDDEKDSISIKTSDGNILRLAPGSLRLEDSQGSFMELTSKVCRIHAETDLEIEAPGHSVVISGQSIDFERA